MLPYCLTFGLTSLLESRFFFCNGPNWLGLCPTQHAVILLGRQHSKVKNKWCHFPDINWCIIEANSCTSSSLSALLFAPLSICTLINLLYFPYCTFGNTWRQHFGLKSPSVLTPICNNHLLLPSTMDTASTHWKEMGLVSFCDLYLDETHVLITLLLNLVF